MRRLSINQKIGLKGLLRVYLINNLLGSDFVITVVILNLEAPQSVKQLRATLGHTRYYRKFVKIYAKITTPMEKLLKKDFTYC